jgi:Tfp pilus assembly protein PilF
VALINDAVLRIDQNTAMRLVDITPKEQERSLLDVFSGAIQSFSRRPKFLQVNTPYLNGSVEGTEFAVRVEGESTSITVFEGVVVAANPAGQVAVAAGESAQAAAGTAPQRRVVVRPRDQVHWSLYYPPVLSVAEVAAASPELEKAANCAANGNTACAFAELDAIPASRRGADHALLRASLLLSVGRVDEAAGAIDAALARDSGSGEAHALKSVIAVAQNDVPAALASGQKAVETAPGSPAARIALSYALQADLQLEAARDTLRVAVEGNPEAALAWARLAEMELALGDRRAANRAAETAAKLQPGLGRTQNVLGFAALAEIRVRAARHAFEQAIALDSADPLPHLGLGLAKIRMGALDEGRADIEAAVALDSNNALLRAYLGKAYFEEKRGPLDAHQFEIAMELDPQDPTAYLYDAIRLQTENRPVEALGQLEASIERNDNRAVYRSRLLLDQDSAARGVSLANIYGALGYEAAAISKARSSLSESPSNASAHRFLSDSYQQVRRREISRVSELLQSQLLQDININPVQPSVSETNLNVATSAFGAGFNEYAPLFERNRAQGNASVFAGSNETVGGEAVVSGIYDQFSLSAGAYTYESDGWRPNNFLEQDIFNIYAQAAITPEFNMQLEFRRRESREGDLAFNFDPNDYLEDKTVDRDQDTSRLGFRYSPSVASTFLFSYIYNERTERLRQSELLPPPFVSLDLDATREDDGDQFETQYILEQESFNIVLGGAHSAVDVTEARTALIYHALPPFPLIDPGTGEPIIDPGTGAPILIPPPDNPIDQSSPAASSEIQHSRLYLYSNIELSPYWVLTLGGSYDDYEEGSLTESGFYPKAGVQWSPRENLAIRAAAFKSLKPPVVNNRTLEPTQVGGFNQFFDDINAAESTRYAVAFDWSPSRVVSVGATLSQRDLDEPVFLEGEGWRFEDRTEQAHRAYLFWTPHRKLAVNAAVEYDRYEAELSQVTAEGNVPEEVETLQFPVNVRYFASNGLIAGIGATYVDQEVVRAAEATQASGSDRFFVVDASVGYRLPGRMGLVSLEINNLFDQDFRYQDDSYREFRDEPATGPFFPERTVMARLVLNFQ